ncbi:hypothetical protein IQ260_10850 [Leptolyngbya cf. ectocarpi LEGE 11479]|uniref:Uncharacterized protein n=1 Tax=Leptolyngbya cf. ectocarpi LEGE 11479 TaxID=1828722 RepID=A0A928ZTT5_LEPEC|nr:hypothetical protein [Leptolyngbya ectocarpi]MBE9067154.1 hypothetical protein [Leptolyngbya cf. ectocarpi LEGE 11479]
MTSQQGKQSISKAKTDTLQAIAYSLDALIPGFYIWAGPIKFRFGGSQPEENYAGTIHSDIGIALVLPGYRIYSTYQDSYDPR